MIFLKGSIGSSGILKGANPIALFNSFCHMVTMSSEPNLITHGLRNLCWPQYKTFAIISVIET